MAKRSKNKTLTVRNAPKNPILKSLIDKTSQSSISQATKQSWEGFKPDRRMSSIASISAATGADINAVIDASRMMGNDELDEMVNDAENLYMEIKIPVNFNSSLIIDDIVKLEPVFRRIVAMKSYDVNSIKEWLECRNLEPIRVLNIGFLAYLFSLLADADLICQNWQQVASEQKVFCSKNGKVLNRLDFAVALAKLKKRTQSRPDEDIYNVVMGLKR